MKTAELFRVVLLAAVNVGDRRFLPRSEIAVTPVEAAKLIGKGQARLADASDLPLLYAAAASSWRGPQAR